MTRAISVFSTVFCIFIVLGSGEVNAEEGHHTLGAQAGQVGLLGDVGNAYGNALGVGAFFDYAASDWLELELNFLTSKHTSNNLNLTQNAYSAFMLYNIDQLDAFVPYLKVGAEFLTHTQDLNYTPINPSFSGVATGQNNTGFGLDIGAGATFILNAHLSAGLDFVYHNLFDVSATPTGAFAAQKVIQSYYTVLLRLGFRFGSNK